MSNTSSSAFNAHSPPYFRRQHHQKESSQADGGENLDMEDIYDDHRKSASEYVAKGVDRHPGRDTNTNRHPYSSNEHEAANVLSADSSS